MAASALAEHTWSTGHHMDLSKTELIDTKPCATTQCLLESWHIQRHPEHAQFTQPFTATYNSHCPHLLTVQEVCTKGLTQLLHYLLVATASCKQNCSATILREGCKNRRYMKWALVRWKRGSNIQRSTQW